MHNAIARRHVNIVHVNVYGGLTGHEQAHCCCLYGCIAPPKSINSASSIHRQQKLGDFGPLPPSYACDEEIGKKYASRRKRRNRWDQIVHVQVLAQPWIESFQRRLMKLFSLQTKSILRSERSKEGIPGQPSKANIFINAHRMRIALQRGEPLYRHEVALRTIPQHCMREMISENDSLAAHHVMVSNWVRVRSQAWPCPTEFVFEAAIIVHVRKPGFGPKKTQHHNHYME